MTNLDLGTSPRILIVALRRLGDVLLTTPLIRSVKRHWPGARIDVLVFADTAPILQGNPDIANVVMMPARPNILQGLSLAWELWNRYALAISTQAGDRPTFFAWVAGRERAGPVEDRLSGEIKRRVLKHSIPVQTNLHRVEEILRIADAIGIKRVNTVIAPISSAPSSLKPEGRYAVIHPSPMFRYKQWHVEGWRGLAKALAERGLTVVVTGGGDEREKLYLDQIWQKPDANMLRVDGKLSWPQLSHVLSQAKVYVGPDTSVTHLAAATGIPTVALYGPTDPRLWGPWPAGGLPEAWSAAGTLQQRGNVWLVQNPLPCMPCQREGCERRLESYSICLEELPLAQVVSALNQALSVGADHAHRGGATA